MHEMRELDELQRFYEYVVAHPNVWGSLAGARFELASGRGEIVEIIPGPGDSSAPSFRARFDRSPRSVSPSVLDLPFLLKKGRLKSLAMPSTVVESFRTFAVQQTRRKEASLTRRAASSSPLKRPWSTEEPPRSPSPLKKDCRKFREIVKKYHIESLYHFTDSRNLASIKRYGGLFSWLQCERRGIKIAAPASTGESRLRDRRKNLEDYVRLSFNASQPMMHVAMDEGRLHDVEILRVDPSVIYLRSTLFSNVNANDAAARIGGDLENFERIRFSIATESRWRGQDEKKLFQAEVLVKSHVSLDLIEIL